MAAGNFVTGSRRAAWTLWSVFAAITAVAVALQLQYVGGAESRDEMLQLASLGAFATVGALIVARLGRHPIGWIYLVGAVVGQIGRLAAGLNHAFPTSSAWLRWTEKVWTVVPLLVLIALPLLLFPDGKPLSRRWRPILWLAIAAVVAVGSYPAFAPGPFGENGEPVNPLGIPGAKVALQGLNTFGLLALGFSVVAAIVSLFVRYRRASGVQREQLKWLGWGGVCTIVLLFFSGPGTFGNNLFPRRVIYILLALVPYMFATAIALIPVATAIAILRYRLWDIDRIVSRTLSYGLVTALLGGVFALVVLVPTTMLSSGDSPGWLVALATLVVFGLFRPVLRRVRSTIDRRFNRARFDAERTINAFSARLRDEIDLATLGHELTGIVGRTMQPEHVSLWVRGGDA